MIDTKALRQKILDMAIKGKLVPQNSNDEPASVLLELIRAEKQRLTKEGKIKKDKNDSVIFKGDDNRYYEQTGSEVKDITDDLPFEIPNSWALVRLSTVCWLGDAAKSTGEKLPYLDAKTLRGKSDKTYLYDGKIVDVGRKVILVDGENSGEVFDVPFRGYMGSTFKTLEKVPQLTFGYLNIVLDYYSDMFRGNKVGTANPHLNKKLFKSLLIGIPPLAEQARIVARVEELFSQIDIIDQNQADIEKLYEEFRKRTLTLAIQGKLVPQDPNDEPASVLLERIRAEKKAKLGKKFVDSYIYKGDDNCYHEHIIGRSQDELVEVPFDIPENWTWLRINNCCNIRNGFTPSRTESKFWINGTIPWFTVEDINSQGKIIKTTKQYITELATTRERIVPANSLLLCCTASVGIFAKNTIALTTNQQFNGLTIKLDYTNMLSMDYLFAIGEYFSAPLHRLAGKTTFEFVSVKKLGQILLPVPPLAEQNRIVTKINEIFAML